MRCKFSNRDLQQRLDQSICRYKNLPVYIRYAGDGDQIFVWNLPSARRGQGDFQIRANDPNFDISTPPLGYFQKTQSEVNYASRRPGRIYKQGISYDNLTFRQIDGKGVMENPVIYEQGFADMIKGVYPSLSSVINEMYKSSEKMTRAISRDIALEWHNKLRLIFVYYKTDQVGFIVEDSNTVIVPSSEKAWVVSKFLHGFSWEVK